MHERHRLVVVDNWSAAMSDSPRRQGLLLVVALLGFATAALITYVRNKADSPPRRHSPDATFVAAQNGDVNTYNPRTVVRPFKPIKDAPFIKVSDVKGQVSDNELVLGIEINGQSRAYPINMLCGPQREIINDTVGNRAIAATW